MKVKSMLNTILNEIKMLNYKKKIKIIQFSFIHMWQRWSSRERLQNKEQRSVTN